MPRATSHLTVQGMRARDLSLEIGPLTLITGPMGSSKTTAADALRFLALGHVPALGKSEAATAALIRGHEMGVQLGLPDGRMLTRGLKRTGKGIKGTALASWVQKGKPSEHGTALLHLFGSDKESAAEHLDLRGLIHATPNQRAARLEGLLASTAMDPAETLGWLMVLATCRMARQDRIPADLESAKSLAAGLRHGLSEGEGAALDSVFAELEAVFDEQGLAGALDRAGEIRREEGTATKQGRAARTKIEDRRAGMTLPIETISALEIVRDTATADQATIEERVRAYQSGASERAEAAQAVTDASAVLSALAEGEPAARSAHAESVELDGKALALAIPEVPPALDLPEIDPALGAAVDEAERLAREHALKDQSPEPRGPARPVFDGTAHLEEDVAEAREALEMAGSSPWFIVSQVAKELDGWSAAGQAGAYVRERAALLRALGKEHGLDQTELEDALLNAGTALETTEARNKDRQRSHEAEAADHDKARTAWLDAERDHVEIAVPLQSAVKEAKAAKRAAEEGIREERKRLTAAHEEAQATRRAALTERETLVQQARSALQKWDDHQAAVHDAKAVKSAAGARVSGMAIVEEVDLEEAATQIADLAQAVTAAQDSIDALQAAHALDGEMGQLAEQIERGTVRLEASKGMEHGLHTLRERDLAERGKPLTDRLRGFLHAAGMMVEPYVRAKARALDFGWIIGRDGPQIAGMDVPLQAMSGGETVLFMAGMAAAVIALRGPEIRLLLIEGAECQDHLCALMDGCASVSDEITHTIITTQRAPDVFDGAWTHLTLGVDSPAVAAPTP